MEMYDKMQDVISEAVKQIQAQKDKLLFERICQRVETNEPINLDEEVKRRFPRLMREYNRVDQSEHWYWNDGTKEGQHLISFYQSIETDIMTEPYKANFGFTYR